MFSIETIQTNTSSARAQRVMPEAAVEALVELGRMLQAERYAFTALGATAHQRVNQHASDRDQLRARDLRDVFGWNRPFTADLLCPRMLDVLSRAQQLTVEAGALRSGVRFASLEGRLFVHSALGTNGSGVRPAVGSSVASLVGAARKPAASRAASTPSAPHVAFGPDTYRFCDRVDRWAPARARCVVEMDAGTAAGVIMYGARAEKRVALVSHPSALAFAAVNAALNGQSVHTVHSDSLSAIDCVPELIIADLSSSRDVLSGASRDDASVGRDGAALHVVTEALSRLPRGGQLILCTRAAIVGGVDTFLQRLKPRLLRVGSAAGVPPLAGNTKRFEVVAYQELDPDTRIANEALTEPPHVVDRIALVGVHAVVA